MSRGSRSITNRVGDRRLPPLKLPLSPELMRKHVVHYRRSSIQHWMAKLYFDPPTKAY
jgi:hypothetical protein